MAFLRDIQGEVQSQRNPYQQLLSVQEMITILCNTNQRQHRLVVSKGTLQTQLRQTHPIITFRKLKILRKPQVH